MASPDREKTDIQGLEPMGQELSKAIEDYQMAVDHVFAHIAPAYKKNIRAKIRENGNFIKLKARIDEKPGEIFPALIGQLKEYGYSIVDVGEMTLEEDSLFIWTFAEEKDHLFGLASVFELNSSGQHGCPGFWFGSDSHEKMQVDPQVLNEITDFININADRPKFFSYEVTSSR